MSDWSRVLDGNSPILGAPGRRNSNSEWIWGIAIGLSGVILWWLWTFWGRSFQLAVALAGAACAIGIVRYPRVGTAIFGFLMVSNVSNFLPGSTSLFFGGMLIVLLARKILLENIEWRVSGFLLAAILFATYYQATYFWVEQYNFYHWHLFYRVLLAIIVLHELFLAAPDFKIFFIGVACGMIFTSISAISSAYEFYATGIATQIAGNVSEIQSARFFGHWPDPNIMSLTLAMYLGGIIALWRASSIPLVLQLLFMTAVALSIIAIGISLSRGGMVSCFMTIALMLAVERRRFLLFSLFTMLIVATIVVVPTDIFGRIMSLASGDASTSERAQLALNGWKLFWDSPVWGAGMGAYEHKILWQLTYLAQGVFAHNTIVDIAVDGGLIALFLYGVCLWIAVRGLTWSDWNVDSSDTGAMLNAGLRASFVGALFTLVTFSTVAYVPMWTFLAVCALHRRIGLTDSVSRIDAQSPVHAPLA